MSEIYSIVYQPQRPRQKPTPPHYVRVPIESVNLIERHGIEGDRKGGNPQRQLNVMSYEMLEVMRSEGFKTAPGEMGEQIILRGVDVMNLPSGTRLQLGDEAVIEIQKPRIGCEWFEEIQRKPVELTTNRLGMLAKVVRGGRINVGDPVKVLALEKV